MKDMMDTEILRRIALWNARNGGSRSGDTSGSGEDPFIDGGTDGYGVVRSAVTDTFYNMISDGTFVAGTDASSSAYAAFTATALSGTWSGKALNSVSATGKTYVRSLGGYYAAFVKDSECVEFWGTSTGAVSSGGVHVRDFIYAGSTIYRLSYSVTDGVTTYAVHSMTDPVTVNALVYSTTDEITWIASNGSSLLVVINDRIYMVTSATEITSVYETLSNGSGIIKLIAHGSGYIAISKMGNYAYCITSETVWFTRRLGNYRFADVCSTGSLIYLINKDGQIYSGTTANKLTMFKRFSTDPISINYCGFYLVVTYVGKIEYTFYQSVLKLKDVGINISDGINQILYFEGKYYVRSGTSILRGSSIKNLSVFSQRVSCMTLSNDGEKLYFLTTDATTTSLFYISYLQDGVVTTHSQINAGRTFHYVWNTLDGSMYLYGSYAGNYGKLYLYKYNSETSLWENVLEQDSYECSYLNACYNPIADATYVSWRSGWADYYNHSAIIKGSTLTEISSEGTLHSKNIGNKVFANGRLGNVTRYRGSEIEITFSGTSGSTHNLYNIQYNGANVPICDLDYINDFWVASCVDGCVYASMDRFNWAKIFSDSRLVMSASLYWRDNYNMFLDTYVVNNKLLLVYYVTIDGVINTRIYIGE